MCMQLSYTAVNMRYPTDMLLAAYLSVKHFRHNAEPGKVVVYIDHKPLIHALQSHSDKISERAFHQLDFLAQFNIKCVCPWA